MILKLTISNGKSILELKLNKLGSYLKFNKPLAMNWYDCAGSIGQYFAIFSFCQEYKDAIDEGFRDALNTGNFEVESQAVEIVKLLSLFENADYELSFEPEYKYEISRDWNWYLAKNYKLFTSNTIIREEAQQLFSDDKAYLNYLSETYYEGIGEYFIFTQPSEKLNKERIQFYQEEIIQGRKPVAIIYSGCAQTSGSYEDGSNWIKTTRSGQFIIDGHHKLMAYKNLNCAPALLRIEKIYEAEYDFNFSIADFENDLAGRLQNCQAKHFRTHYSGR